jgi:hypothetical protein
MIGGTLARPCISYPSIFPPGTIWERFPYLLPNLFSASAVFCGVVIGILFLEETHKDKKLERDCGLELGRRLTAWVKKCTMACTRAEKQAPQREAGDDVDELPGYSASEDTPLLLSAPGEGSRDSLDLPRPETEKPAPIAFTRPVILNIISYAVLAL